MTSIPHVAVAPTRGLRVPQRWLGAATHRLAVVVAVPMLIALMDWVYVNSLLWRFGEVEFPGFPNAHHAPEYTILCWALGTIPALWLPLSARRPSQVMTWMMYLTVHVPTVVLAPHAYLPWDQGLTMLLLTIAGLMILQLASILPRFRLPRVQLSPAAFWVLITVQSAVAYVMTVRAFGSIMRFVSLAEVYLQRGFWIEARADALTSYLMTWQSVAINPLLMAYGIVRRRPIPLLIGLAGQFFLFSVAAQRHLLAMPLAMIGLYVLTGKSGRAFGIKVVAGSALAFSVPLLLGDQANALVVLVVDLLLFRLFLNSGLLATLYFEYFRRNPSVMFTQVKPFSWMFHSPYLISYKEALAWDVWGRYNDPNTSIFADGFAQLGAAGVIIESVGLALLLWLFDSVAAQRRFVTPFLALLLGSQLGAITNGQIPNMILGGGTALLLIYLWLMPDGARLTEPTRVERVPEPAT